jgi:hypothetical protein
VLTSSQLRNGEPIHTSGPTLESRLPLVESYTCLLASWTALCPSRSVSQAPTRPYCEGTAPNYLLFGVPMTGLRIRTYKRWRSPPAEWPAKTYKRPSRGGLASQLKNSRKDRRFSFNRPSRSKSSAGKAFLIRASFEIRIKNRRFHGGYEERR